MKTSDIAAILTGEGMLTKYTGGVEPVRIDHYVSCGHGCACDRPHVSSTYSASTRWTNETAIEPSPTADATRLMLPDRTSPTANTPGREVSSR